MNSIEERTKILFCGDSAIAVQFGETADIETNLMVRALDLALKEAHIRGVVETVPTYRSEMIHYNPLIIPYKKLCEAVEELMKGVDWDSIKPSNEVVVVPIYYKDPKAEIKSVAEYEHISEEDVIRIHTNRYHYAFMMGVAPGTAYLSSPTGSFTIPRKSVPVPKPYASSIQIWSTHTTISPFHSQSGWHMIGRVPACCYNPKRPEDPFLVIPGQWVRFRSIEKDEFEYIEQEFLNNRYERELIHKDLSELPFSRST